MKVFISNSLAVSKTSFKSGQIGKTTLMLQVAVAMLHEGVPPANMLYATFDHLLLKLAGMDAVLQAGRERKPTVNGPEFIIPVTGAVKRTEKWCDWPGGA
ncbi:MAG: hypothetical protein ORN28_05795, partial [Rhodoferax sp.]|nr:hypothetical protein [Rhodoferax sp.]